MKNYKILILGGGTGGISMAARLVKHFNAGSIAIIEPSSTHYYQPFWTLIGGGIGKKEQTGKPTKCYIPKGVDWIQSSVKAVLPDQQQVITNHDQSFKYDCLIISTGLEYQYENLKGLSGNLGKNGIHTIYDYKGCEETFKALNSIRKGEVLFTMPPPPMKCPGAPQKIMYLADEIFRKNNCRDQIQLSWYTAGAAMFGVPTFAAPLKKIVDQKNIHAHFGHKLIEIKADQKTAVFEKNVDGKTEILEKKFDFIHVIPPQGAHGYLKQSPLLHQDGLQKGFLKVDIHTLQHQDYKNIFGIGDITGVPNSKTGAAIRNAAPLLVKNILSFFEGKELTEKYSGYASCPLVTGYGKVILAEFGYDGKLMPSFPLDPQKEHYVYWILKRYLLPIFYWWGMLRGRM